MGLTNVKLMIPFVRTVAEGRGVIDLLEDNGLKRGENGLEVVMMCEVPSNALLAGDFLEVFDGFSIGSNDLTQLTLGLDRDSSLIAESFGTNTRYSGAGLGYQLASVIAGGPAPLIAAAILQSTGSSTGISIYIVICAVISLIALVLLPRREGRGGVAVPSPAGAGSQT